MTPQGWLQIAIYVAVLTALVPPLGGYMARVYQRERTFLTPVVGPLERLIYRCIGVRPEAQGQDWKAYGKTVILFSALFWGFLYLILRTQDVTPFNPQGFGSGPWDLSFNTTSSFITNTNWQFYGGETTLSYFSQMFGLAVQNFISAAVGMAVLAAVIRGFASRGAKELGNFWEDLTRSVLYILLPISIVGALILVSQGVVQTFAGGYGLKTLGGFEQVLSLGPAASQVAIKQLGTNGGGFWNVNSSFPFENPTGFSNFVENLFILLIPAAATAQFGRMVGSRRQGWALYAAMLALLVVSIGVSYGAEQNGSPAQHAAGVSTAAADGTTGGNLEGKEQRFGIADSSLWETTTTAASNGSVNSAHDSYTGLGGATALSNMMTGEVVFGGVGSGLYGMLLFVLLAVFIAGLMVGRTPEYLGKKVHSREVKLVLVGVLTMPLIVLFTTALAVATKYGGPSVYNPLPQGFSETLYAYVSQGNNNGSAFAGFTGFVQPNAPGNVGSYTVAFANIAGGLTMLICRFIPLLAALAVAGSLAPKRPAPVGLGTMRTDSPTFVVLLIGTILLVALLTFVPALLLGPVVQSLTTQLF